MAKRHFKVSPLHLTTVGENMMQENVAKCRNRDSPETRSKLLKDRASLKHRTIPFDAIVL